MRCPKCGTENAEGKILCRTCGTRLRPPLSAKDRALLPTRETEPELRQRVTYDLMRDVWVIAVVIAAGLGLGVLLK
ncbi:MAG TPA: zinc-ribbon domain-containing protein [bacterium]|nr:zinc-ribbon domain-containing protein [bacterium]